MSTPHPEVFDIRDARVRISDLERELAMEKSASAECVVQMVRSGVTSFGYLKDAIRVLGEQRDAAQSELAAEREKYAALALAYGRTDAELKACQRECSEWLADRESLRNHVNGAETEILRLRDELAICQRERDALNAELAEANAVLRNPEKWHKWCDIRVLEQLEAARVELAARERQLSICEAVVDQHAGEILKLRDELARARDDEARLLTGAMHALRAYQFGNADPTLAQQTADAIELRISERAK